MINLLTTFIDHRHFEGVDRDIKRDVTNSPNDDQETDIE